MTTDPTPDPGLTSTNSEPPPATASPTASPSAPASAPFRRASGAEIAASMAHTEDPDLDLAVQKAMEETPSADWSDAAATGAETAEPGIGSIVTGRIANIGSRDVLIDLGLKSFGAMPLADFDSGEKYSIGDPIEVLITGSDERSGLLNVSRRKARQTRLLRELKVGLEVEGTVTGMNKGGLEILFEGLRGFIPASQVDIRFMRDISELIGQKVRAEVTKVEMDDENPNIVLSRRNCLIREEARRKEQLLNELKEGDIRRGRVRSITDYGAFVDLGGVDGLLHIRDMSWGHVAKPQDVVAEGQEIDVMVTKVSRDTKKISLSLKQTITNPWESAAERYPVGTRVKGRVVRLADFGAFVELEPGVDGLLPLGEMSWTKRVRRPDEVVKVGDVIDVAVTSIDQPKRRISLSLKALSEDPWAVAANNYPVGSVVKGKVARLADFGAFVNLEEGIDGLVHISELSDERVKTVGDKVRPGDEVEVRVLAVDTEAKKISLSMRKPPAEPSPEEIAEMQAARAAAERKKPGKPRRGGITFGWDQGLGSLDPSNFAR